MSVNLYGELVCLYDHLPIHVWTNPCNQDFLEHYFCLSHLLPVIQTVRLCNCVSETEIVPMLSIIR